MKTDGLLLCLLELFPGPIPVPNETSLRYYFLIIFSILGILS